MGVVVCAQDADDAKLQARARAIAVQLDLPCWPHLDAERADIGQMLVMMVTPRRLELYAPDGPRRMGRPIGVEVSSIDARPGAGSRLSQPLARALGIRRHKTRTGTGPRVIDATAGWGSDALLMSLLGCCVLAVERHPIVAALLRDGLERAQSRHQLLEERLELVQADARQILADLAGPDRRLPEPIGRFADPDVVYLDPMYPVRPPRRSLEPKPLRVLRRLVGPDDDADGLLEAACAAADRRVVVKRPRGCQPLAGARPTVSHLGKSLRYDVYVTRWHSRQGGA